MKRKLYNLLLVAMLSFLPLTGWAVGEAAPDASAAMPFTMIEPPITGESRTVRMFFLFTCPYCRQAAELVRWGNTLPKSFRFIETPVVGSTAETIVPAIAFLAVQSIAPDRSAIFSQAAYQLVQDQGKVVSDPKTYYLACKIAGVDLQQFSRAVSSEPVKKLLVESARLTTASNLTSTPSIVAGGHILITPEVTGGINESFYKLANAIVSKLMVEGGLL